MNQADKQLLQRIALAFTNLDADELTIMAQLAPGLTTLSPPLSAWVESLYQVEAQRRAGEDVYFPPAQWVEASDGVVGGALSAALCLVESTPTERLQDAAFAVLYFCGATAHVRLAARTIGANN